MKVITSADVTEYDLFLFSAEASELGLKPGEWPEELETTVGNKLNFIRQNEITHAGEFGGFVYIQVGGCISLKVFND